MIDDLDMKKLEK